MIIYKDIVTGDEIISDSYDLIEKDDAVYEVNCRKISVGGDSFDIGANASAEEANEDVEDGAKQVIDVVHSFRLSFLGDEDSGTRVFPDKKAYMGHLKTYMKKVEAKLKETGADASVIDKFKNGAQNYFKNVISPNFKDYDFYGGESMDIDGMVVLLNYREDGMTPYITVWKYGLSEMKV